MGKLWDKMTAREGMTYDEAIAEQKKRRSSSSQSLLGLIGSGAIDPITEAEGATEVSQLTGTPGTGMYADASPQMVTQLDQISGMLGSGDSALMKKGLKQYDEFIQPPTGDSDPNSYKEWQRMDPKTRPPYGEWMLQGKKALGGALGGNSMDIKDLQNISIEDQYGNLRPVKAALTKDMFNTNKGPNIQPGEKYVVNPNTGEMDYQRVRDQAILGLGELEELAFTGEDHIFDDDYRHNLAGQAEGLGKYLSQDDDAYMTYVGALNGMAGQFARIISGEKGALRDEDIQRVLGIFPQVAHWDSNKNFIRGDSKAVAERKFALVKRLMRMAPEDPEKAEKILDDTLKDVQEQDAKAEAKKAYDPTDDMIWNDDLTEYKVRGPNNTWLRFDGGTHREIKD